MGVAFFFLGLFFLYASPVQAYYACGGGPCDATYTCDLGRTCSGGVCGINYNACTGAGNLTCNATGGWDQTTCNTANLCTPAGTTRTAGSWGAFGVCSAACGVGTQTQTCACGNQNNCATACTSPAGACGGTNSQACCVSSAPQAPVITSAGNNSCTTNGTVSVNWTFGVGGCGGAWGYACSTPSNTFLIKDGAATIASGIPSGTSPYSSSVTLSSGSHSITVCANNGISQTCSSVSNVTINVDTTAPPVPVPTIRMVADAACSGKYFIAYSWNAVNDIGCAGIDLSPTPVVPPYKSQASSALADSTNIGAFSMNLFPNDGFSGNTFQTTTLSDVPGTKIYTHVRSRDLLSTRSAWSGPETVTIPTPSPYPTIHVSGPLVEDNSRTCTDMSLLSNITLSPVVMPALGVTPVCTMPTTSSYSCNFTINNTSGLCVSPNISVTMTGSYSGYGSIGWRTGATSAEQCIGYPVSKTFAAGDAPATIPIYLTFNAVLPTATPTPTPGGPTLTPTPIGLPTPTPILPFAWFKLSGTSFVSQQNNRQNFIPYYVQKYDTTDVINHYILSGNAGLLVQNTSLAAGANALDAFGKPVYSQNNWYTSNGYSSVNDMDYTRYIEYLKARKDYKTITNLSDIPADGIYSISSSVTLSSTNQFDGKKVVLVVQGDSATFNANFIPVNGSVAIVAKNIIIDPSVTEIDGILIGQTVSTGDSDVNGLKIKGNLIDEDVNGLAIGRNGGVGSKPSLFVVFDPKTYLDVIPYLSTSTYDWRQLQ